MKIEFTHEFIKIYKRRIDPNPRLKKRFEEKTRLFSINPANLILKDHALIGKMKGSRSFSISGDIRVIYYITDNIAYFTNIGTHNQVY